MTKNRFPYGASYYPLVYPEGEWDRDFQLMQQAGINKLRTGDVHGGWDRIEPQKGTFEFEILDKFFNKAKDYGIDILFTIGVASPPLWLLSEYPDVQLVSSRGENYPLGASYHWACINHPGFVAEARRYTTEIVKFCIKYSNIASWQITNEIGFPFMPTREQNILDLFCYCPNCREKFRQYVRQKYQTLESLTENWTWSTTAFVYNSWSEVEPPEVLPNAWSGVTRWIDWRLFWQEQFAQLTKNLHQQIREYDQDRPTMVNTFNFKGFDRFGTFTGLDQWQIAKETDHIGYDLYPGTGQKLKTRPEHNSIFLDHGRSVSRANGKDFWIPELESGPVGGWVLGPDHNTGSVDILRNGFECLGHNAKLMLYMGWKEWEYQSLGWGGIVELDGEPREHFPAVQELSNYIKANTDFLLSAQVEKGEIALLESKPNAIFFRGIDKEETLFHAQRGAYMALTELDYRVDFITPEQVVNGYARDYKAICLPLMAVMDEATNQALLEYVQQGGVLIGFARSGRLDQRGWYRRTTPTPQLADVFGIKITGAEPGGLAVNFAGQQYPGAVNREYIVPASGTQVVASFADGRPAVLVNSLGKGLGIYFATMADYAYGKENSLLLKRGLHSILGEQGLAPEVTVTYPEKVKRELDHHLLQGKDRTTVILTNYLAADTCCTIRVPARGSVERIETGLLTKTPVAWQIQQGTIQIELDTKAEQTGIVDIYWGDAL